MSYDVKCIPNADVNFERLLSGDCPGGYKRALVPSSDFTEFNGEAFDLGLHAVLLAFVVGLGVGLILTMLRRIKA
jgi:hypothetical protein